VCLAGQVEVEAGFLDLTVAPFEPSTPGCGGNVVEKKKKKKLANAICPIR
jgi:hypothetical protein